MATVQDFYREIDSFAPFSSALPFDNPGLLVGDPEKEVKTVLLSLDIPVYVAREAAQKKVDLVISHHPVIFDPMKAVLPSHSVYHLIQNGVAAICAHTNLDAADGGVNDVLCRTIGLSDCSYFSPSGEINIGRIGTLSSSMSVRDFALSVKQKLGADHIDFADAGRPVRKIAVVSGSGGEAFKEALLFGCDTFLTGESKYHYYAEAVDRGINLIAAGHYATENPVIFSLKERLEERFQDVRFLVSETNVQLPFSV